MNYISVVAVFMCAFYELLYAQSASYTGDVDTSEYNMELAYSILPHVLMVSWRALKSFVILNIAPMLLGLMLLLSFGTRGPVICAIVFIAIYLLFIRPSKYQKTMRIITVACAVYAMSFLDQFMTFMQLMTFQLGMSTRIFDKYFEGELEESSGRDYIRETLLRELSIDNSLFGHGVLGSYPYVNTYPHNIVLEFLFSFGWVWGIAILFCIVYIIAKMLINTHMRKDFLEKYLENEHLALVFYSLGEKCIIPKKGYQSIGESHDLSGAYYLEKGKIVEIQPMHISNTIR